jgi:hypothetical protein
MRAAFINVAQSFTAGSRHPHSAGDLRRGGAVRFDGVVAGRDIRAAKETTMKVRNVLGLAAVGAALVLAAPAERAQAMSLASPGAAAAVQDNVKPATTEVRWWHHRHRHWRWHHRRHWRRW